MNRTISQVVRKSLKIIHLTFQWLFCPDHFGQKIINFEYFLPEWANPTPILIIPEKPPGDKHYSEISHPTALRVEIYTVLPVQVFMHVRGIVLGNCNAFSLQSKWCSRVGAAKRNPPVRFIGIGGWVPLRCTHSAILDF